jgi:hypothetical protein
VLLAPSFSWAHCYISRCSGSPSSCLRKPAAAGLSWTVGGRG